MHELSTVQYSDKIRWDNDAIEKFNISGPRYTSYPTALQFHEEFGVGDYVAAIERTNQKNKPLSLYFHLPFCNTICYYCACNKIVTADRSRSRHYLDHLISEIRLQANLFQPHRPVTQLHWGGGTPTFFSEDEMTELMYHSGRNFNLLSDQSAEYSIEIDPRNAPLSTLSLLRGLGFNRISIGIQDFDETVQQAVNRVQSYQLVEQVFNNARDLGFNSISVDLIYGLPHQTADTFKNTITKIINLDPDRISLFNYAHLPARFKTQKQIRQETLPAPNTKLSIMCDASNRLIDAGYCYIGMDHFAKYDDELAVAQREKTLQRNFQGYSTARHTDLVGLGISAISKIDNIYSQNFKHISDYAESIENQRIPIERGYSLSVEDQIRRDIICELICHNSVSKSKIEKNWHIEFRSYFDNEIKSLQNLSKDGLINDNNDEIIVTDKGRLFIRKICMVFDQYSHLINHGQQFSRII